jgi:hypothetical protein
MRFLIFASILLMAISAIGQNQPSTRISGQGGQASSQLDGYATTYPQTNSGLCYAIRTFTMEGNGEQLHPYKEAPAPTTCTPANRFRVKYIPKLTFLPYVRRAKCPGCSTVPMRQQPPSESR